MAKKDLKKIEYTRERHDLAEDIVAIRNLKSISQEKKDELIKFLLDKKEFTQAHMDKTCPFPQHKGYSELWNILTPNQQKDMIANIKISDDGKIEIIKMKKRFSLLTAEHNGKDIFKGEHEDPYGNKGEYGVTYLTGRSAEQECYKQKRNLLKNRAELEKFISYFPGDDEEEKCINFVKLFGLEKAGYWNPNNSRWEYCGSVGYAKLSRVNENDYVYGVIWNDDNASIYKYNQIYPSPFVACEDILV